MTLRAPTADAARAAEKLIAPHVRRTPVVPVGGGHLKLESLQPTGSFKVRGFFNAALGADPHRREAGLMTVSAGNAALACAHVARHLGIPCRVLMFDTAPQAKRAGVERLGARVIPMAFQDLLDWLGAERWRQEPELFIHPFADERVMTGHATIALELLEQLPKVERVIVPVGAGGLITGVAATLKSIRPGIEVVGVQSDGYPLWEKAFRAGGPVSIEPNTIADGTTGPFTADMFGLLRKHVDRWVVVPGASCADPSPRSLGRARWSRRAPARSRSLPWVWLKLGPAPSPWSAGQTWTRLASLNSSTKRHASETTQGVMDGRGHPCASQCPGWGPSQAPGRPFAPAFGRPSALSKPARSQETGNWHRRWSEYRTYSTRKRATSSRREESRDAHVARPPNRWRSDGR